MHRVLVVDDEKVIADTLAVIFRQAGFYATAVYNASSALEYLENDRLTLLISDVMMPGMNGVDLAIEVRKRCPDCKVLLFSGVSQSANLLEEARKEGHDFEFLQKPIHPSDFLAKARTTIEAPHYAP